MPPATFPVQSSLAPRRRLRRATKSLELQIAPLDVRLGFELIEESTLDISRSRVVTFDEML